MKKLLLVAGATGIALGLVSAGAAGARSQATRVQIGATMVAGEETPTPKGDVSAARGSFTGTLTKTDRSRRDKGLCLEGRCGAHEEAEQKPRGKRSSHGQSPRTRP